MVYTVNYALEKAAAMMDEIKDDYYSGRVTDKGTVLRLFCLGKSLIGWQSDDPRPDYEIMNSLLTTNRVVMETLDRMSEEMAS